MFPPTDSLDKDQAPQETFALDEKGRLNSLTTVLTQEVVRIRKNIHPDLPWEITAKHLNNFSQRLRLSGYDEAYRYQVIKSGVEGFEKKLSQAEQGGRPINSPRTWEEDLRQKNKY